jgi:glycosyltransferase involved in cell wall biosynthesis
MKRIALVIESCSGGSGRHFLDLARGLIQSGQEVHVVYSAGRAAHWFEEEVRALGAASIARIEMRRAVGFHDLAAALQLRAHLRRLGPLDVIHAHSSKAGALTRLFRQRGARMVYTPHAFVTMRSNQVWYKRLLFGAIERLLLLIGTDRLIATSGDERDHALKLWAESRKIRVVYNGLPKLEFLARPTVRCELMLSREAFVVGFVGRFAPQKRPRVFLSALAKVRARAPDIRGVMIGSGELETEVNSEMRALGLESVVVKKESEAAWKYMPGFDVLLMCSDYEGFPYVLIEALQAGLPVVTNRVGGTPELVSEAGNGIVLSHDAEASDFADALIHVRANPALLADMSERARRRSKDFGVDEMVANTLRVYSD